MNFYQRFAFAMWWQLGSFGASTQAIFKDLLKGIATVLLLAIFIPVCTIKLILHPIRWLVWQPIAIALQRKRYNDDAIKYLRGDSQ